MSDGYVEMRVSAERELVIFVSKMVFFVLTSIQFIIVVDILAIDKSERTGPQ